MSVRDEVMLSKKISSIVIMIIFCGLISFLVAVNAWYTYTIQLSQYWAADSGKHLDWSGSSKYISQFRMAVNK